MKKKIIIGISIIVLVTLAFIGYQLATTKSHSPSETKAFNYKGMDVKVVYCRPYKKDRLIFGEEKDGALQPYGHYWRLGANEATQITFSKNLLFAGKPLPAGTYWMYAIPGATVWQVALNSELGKWGALEPDYSKDVLKVDVPARENTPVTEQFTINFSNDSTAAYMDFIWDNTKVIVPITPQ